MMERHVAHMLGEARLHPLKFTVEEMRNKGDRERQRLGRLADKRRVQL